MKPGSFFCIRGDWKRRGCSRLPSPVCVKGVFPQSFPFWKLLGRPLVNKKQRLGWLQGLQMCPQLLPAVTCSLPICRPMTKPMINFCHCLHSTYPWSLLAPLCFLGPRDTRPIPGLELSTQACQHLLRSAKVRWRNTPLRSLGKETSWHCVQALNRVSDGSEDPACLWLECRWSGASHLGVYFLLLWAWQERGTPRLCAGERGKLASDLLGRV